LKYVFHYLRPYVPKMLVGFLIKFTGTIMDLCLPWILAYVIDNVIPIGLIGPVIWWGVVMLACSVVAVVTNILANRMAAAVARDTTRRIRYDLFRKVAYLTNRQVDKFTIPSLISRMTSDTYNIHQMVGMMQRIGIRAPILLIGGILVTLTLDPVLTLVLVSVLPFIVLITVFVSRKGVPLFRLSQEMLDNMVRVVRENAAGIRVIKALSKTEDEKRHFDNVNKQVIQAEKKASMTMASISPAMNLLLNVGLTLVVLVGAMRVNGGQGEVGEIVAFTSYFTIILNAMMTITRIFTMYSKASASANRIGEVLSAPEEMTKQPETQIAAQDDHIVFDHVYFSYNKKEDNLTDIHFSIKRGETMGIIGPTGAGKSTIAQLLLRFYDVDKGEIRIGGRNIREFDPGALREKFGVVFQNDVLFEDTIAENIRVGRDIKKESLEKAAQYAQAADFIAEKEGYGSELAIKGANLSGGQKQRVLIARALAGNPEILILDDSSSALDYKTDASLRNDIRTHYSYTTTILIAQRVSTVMRCDHIMVLDDGKIVGYGTHAELMESCELYKEIERIQMGGADRG
jgi:ATP-binding cassette, subfamily B, multidrug efflux pump